MRRGAPRDGSSSDLRNHQYVRAYEKIEQAHPVLILETLTGATLAYLIDNSRRRLPLSDIVHLGLHLCSAIHYLHRRGILHPDLKPSNMVSERRLAKVLDPSIARLPGKGVKGVVTENYMSPEQARGDALDRLPTCGA